MPFPPIPVFPTALDSDFTLFRVYNTAEAPLSADSLAYADHLDIVPQEREMWAANGFVNLDGELIYYEGLDRNGDGQVIRLKRCLRGINGFSHFNPAGTYVRGFVVAEQHNQMALATILTEQFVGYNFTPDEATLDFRIRNLADQARIPDDFSCPEVQFDFQVVSSSPATGTVVAYTVTVNGPFGNAVIAFGDGTTSTVLNGTHTYSVNSRIDPVVTVTNGDCQIVQTPIERDEVAEPVPPEVTPPFTVPVPVTPAFPSLIFPSTVLPSIDLLPPPFIDSCLDLSPLNGLSVLFNAFSFAFGSLIFPSLNMDLTVSLEFPTTIPIDFGPLPSVPPIEFGPPPSFAAIEFTGTLSVLTLDFPSIPPIEFGPLPPIPSVIEFGAVPAIPSTIEFLNIPSFPSEITFGAAPSFPTQITFGAAPSIPTVININYSGGVPTVISVVPPASFPAVTFGTPPTVSVDWGTPPSCVCTVVVVCPTSSGMAAAATMRNRGMYEPVANDIAVEYDMAGLPSVISILSPDRPIRVESAVPSVIRLDAPNLKDISLVGADRLPATISILPPSREDMQVRMELVLPEVIELRPVGLPEAIPVVFPKETPLFSFDRSSFPDEIKVTGMPDSIRIEHTIPTRIEVDWSEAARAFSLPPVEVRPVEVKVDFNFDGLTKHISDGTARCFALIPCSP